MLRRIEHGIGIGCCERPITVNEPAVRHRPYSALHKKIAIEGPAGGLAVKNDANRGSAATLPVAAMRERAEQSMRGGVRQIAHLTPDASRDSAIHRRAPARISWRSSQTLLRPQLTSSDHVRPVRRQRHFGDVDRWQAPKTWRLGREISASGHAHVFVTRTRRCRPRSARLGSCRTPIRSERRRTRCRHATRRGKEMGGNQMYVVAKSATDIQVQGIRQIG